MRKIKKKNGMLETYATFRLDGNSKEAALTYLIAMGYKPTHRVLEAIRKKDKHIFFGR